MSSEEDALNTKRLMEQSVPFHPDSHLLRDIYWQREHGKILTDRQKRAFVAETNRLQAIALKHRASCDCGRHNIIYVHVRLLTNVQTFTGQDGVSYALRKGNVVRIPLREVVALVIRRYADFQITTALQLTHEVLL